MSMFVLGHRLGADACCKDGAKAEAPSRFLMRPSCSVCSTREEVSRSSGTDERGGSAWFGR